MSGRALPGLLSLLLGSGCVSRKVEAPTLLPPRGEATLSELVERLNARQRVETLTAAGDLQFETREAAEAGVARRFRKAEGRLLLARPDRLRLQIQVPLLKTSLAEMASQGDHFEILVYPAEHRAFIEGTASRDYSREASKLAEDPELKRVGPLVNVRPQHLLQAFFLDPIPQGDPYTLAVLAQEPLTVPDRRPGARAGVQVVRTYYVVHLIERWPEARLRSKYWFDRAEQGLPLTRRQVYAPDGGLEADITFDQYQVDPSGLPALPTFIRMERPKEAYTLTVTLRPETLAINRTLPLSAFSLEMPAEWADSVRKINLDEK